MHSTLCIHVGQCGLQMGFALWELLLQEHGIDNQGLFNSSEDIGNYEVFFTKSVSDHLVPRGLFIDLEPTVVDQMRTGSFRNLFHPDQLLNGCEDAANNFARGFHTVGRLLKKTCDNRIRKEFEMVDRLESVHFYRSLGGGTGSGLTVTLFESMMEYPKVSKIEIPVHPSPHVTSAIVEPYNCILSEHFCMEDSDISLLLDNEAMFDIISDKLGFRNVTFTDLNRLLAQVATSLTSSARFENTVYNDFNVLTNVVPYPRIHFPLLSYSPFLSEARLMRSTNSVSTLTHALFEASNQMVKVDPISGKYMSCSLIYRGNVSPPEIFNTLAQIKSSRMVRFVDWCPTGFKVGIVTRPPETTAETLLGRTNKNVVMLANSSSVSALWHRLAQKFHQLYAKRSFVHWFVAEGLEESEFCEGLYNLATLAKDYEEVALDTRLDGLVGNIGGGEGGSGVGEGGSQAGVAGAIKAGGEGGEGASDAASSDAADGGDDESEDDDDQENVSNVHRTNNHSDNNGSYPGIKQKLNELHEAPIQIDWKQQFESLLQTLYFSKDMSEMTFSSIDKLQNDNNLTENCCTIPNKDDQDCSMENFNFNNSTLSNKLPLHLRHLNRNIGNFLMTKCSKLNSSIIKNFQNENLNKAQEQFDKESFGSVDSVRSFHSCKLKAEIQAELSTESETEAAIEDDATVSLIEDLLRKTSD